VKTQAEKRKERREQKALERKNDKSAVRGFSTDQRITIESINVNKRTLQHLRTESQMVALGLQETAIRGQLNHAQSMAERQCPKYNKNNMFWKRADQLQELHQETIDAIMKHTAALEANPKEEEMKVDLSDFLLQESPAPKKRMYEDMKGSDDNEVVEILDFNVETNTTLATKIKKMGSSAADPKRVSNRRKRKSTNE
jgi:hypothetical protein